MWNHEVNSTSGVQLDTPIRGRLSQFEVELMSFWRKRRHCKHTIFCLLVGKRLKASDVESPGRNGCWSGSPNQPTFHVMSRSSDQCHEMFISQKSSSIGRGGCRRGWPMAFLLSNSPIRSSISILPALGIVGVRWPMQTISLDWTFILTLAVQFTRDSTTFLRLFSNLNPSPLTTFFKQTMT